MESERPIKKTSFRNPPWSDLPQELLSAISNTLNSNPLDILSFRSVCNPWRYACPPLSPSILSPHFPLPIPRPPFSSPSFYCFSTSDLSLFRYFLTVTVIYAVPRPLHLSEGEFSSSTPNTWMLFPDECNAGKVRVRWPFSRWSYPLPINFPSTINLCDFNALELGRFYNICCFNDNDRSIYPLSKRGFNFVDVDKMVLFPNRLAVVALYDKGKLGMIKLNEKSECGIREWETVHDGKGFRFDDIVEFKGRVLGVDRRARVYEIHCHSSKMKPFVPPIVGGGGRRKRLVESLGLLYLVVRYYADPLKPDKRAAIFKVYELNEEKNKWFQITGIGGRSFFFGSDFSFSASAHELGTCGNNCILFREQSFRSYSTHERCEVFQNLSMGVCHLNDALHFGAIESDPDYSDMVWPPPPWIWSVDRSKRLGILETAIARVSIGILEKYKTINEQTSQGVLDATLKSMKEVVRLKTSLTWFQEAEKKFMDLEQEKKLQETTPRHGLRESIDMLNKINCLLAPKRTSPSFIADRHTFIADRHNRPDALKTALEQFDNGHAASNLIRLVLRERDALLFHIEKRVTLMEKAP